MPSALASFKYPDWVAEVSPAEVTAQQQRDRQQKQEEGVAKEGEDGNEEGEDIPWRLEVLKNGVPLGFESLMDKSVFVVGRQAPRTGSGGSSPGSDLLLEHPSISRIHAIFLHHRNGQLFLVDLCSTHGTKVNKRPLPKYRSDQQQDDANCTEIRPGDMIRFGESTRSFLVHGPERFRPPELESDNMARVRSQLNERRAKQEQAKSERQVKENPATTGVSWGLEEGADSNIDGDDHKEEKEEVLPEYLRAGKEKKKKVHAHSMTQDEMDAKDEVLWQRLQVKLGKMNNMEEENRRILNKEGGAAGLSDGQATQKARNDKRISQLEKEVADIEEEIRRKNLQRGGTNASSLKKRKTSGSESDDDGSSDMTEDSDSYFDRTKSQVRPGGVSRKRRGLSSMSTSHANITSKSQAGKISNTEMDICQRQEAEKAHAVADAVSELGLSESAQTEESLTALAEKLREGLVDIDHDITATQQLAVTASTANTASARTSQLPTAPAIDALDAFMDCNATVAAENNLEKLRMRRERQALQLEAVNQLLRIATVPATPTIAASVSSAEETANSMQEENQEEKQWKQQKEGKGQEQEQQEKKQELDGLRRSGEETQKQTEKKDERDKASMESSSTKVSPQSNRRLEQPDEATAAPPNSTKRVTKGAALPPVTAKRKSEAVMINSVENDFDQTKPTDEAIAKPKAAVPKPEKKLKRAAELQRHTEAPMAFDDQKLEGGELNWKPPEGQTGDGRTELNAKFGY